MINRSDVPKRTFLPDYYTGLGHVAATTDMLVLAIPKHGFELDGLDW